MYLTHIDREGNSSPAILIDNATASNRAVNLPEFVNIAGDGIEDIQVPAVELYKLMDEAMQMQEKGDSDKALLLWKKAVAIEPENAKAQNGMAIALYVHGSIDEAFAHLHHAVRINPMSVESHYVLGKFLLEQGQANQAMPEFQKTISIRPHFTPGEEGLASTYQALGDDKEALVHWRRAHAIEPSRISATLGIAWILASAPDASLRNGTEALSLAESANSLVSAGDPDLLDTLAAAYAENGQFARAAATAKRALDLAVARGNLKMASAIRSRLLLYEAKKPFRTLPTADAAHRAMVIAPAARVSQ
jgi:tetratricopeptide (TPR) repeat protein